MLAIGNELAENIFVRSKNSMYKYKKIRKAVESMGGKR